MTRGALALSALLLVAAAGCTPRRDAPPQDHTEDNTERGGALAAEPGPRAERVDDAPARHDRDDAAPAAFEIDPALEGAVIDLHVDRLWRLWTEGQGARPRSPQASPRQLAAGGVTGQLFAIYTRPSDPDPAHSAWQQVAALTEQLIADGDTVTLATSIDELVAARRSGRLAAFLAMEGAGPLEADPSALDDFHAAGLRCLSLTWNGSNRFGDGVGGRDHGGLSPAGRDLVTAANDLRIVVDVSHASEDTFWDIVTLSERPVIATHSNARSLRDHRRNLDDVQLWAIAASGGVVGVNFHSEFLSAHRNPAAPSDIVAHIRHMVAVMGASHVSIGSDFDGGIAPPAGLDDASRLPELTDAMRRGGIDASDIPAVLGENAIRVLAETERAQRHRRVLHRPIAVERVRAGARADDAANLVDRNVRTRSRIDLGGAPDTRWVEISVSPPVDRLAVAGDTVGADGPATLDVWMRCADDPPRPVGRLSATSPTRPSYLALPDLPCDGLVHLRATAQAPEPADAVVLSELVAERRVDAPGR